jgi:hypothetical protein
MTRGIPIDVGSVVELDITTRFALRGIGHGVAPAVVDLATSEVSTSQ